MGLKTNILLKRTVIISLIGFSIVITAGIGLIFKSSVQRNADHMRLIALTGDSENEILKARNYIDHIVLETDPNLIPELGQCLDSVRYNLEELNRLITRKFGKNRNIDVSSFADHYIETVEALSQINYRLDEYVTGHVTADTALFNTFNRFNADYKDLNSFLPEYLLLNTIRFKREVIGLILVNFIMVLLAGSYIVRLINKLINADRTLIRKTIDVEKRERERIAADLHDGLGSILSGLIIHIRVVEKESEENPELKAQLNHLNLLANHALQSIEEVINNLNPRFLSRYGLINSLEKITEKMNKLGKTQFSVDAEKFSSDLSKNTELLLYRICSELINNAIKHSSAEKAEFSFYNHKKEVRMIYRDDGIGFDPDQTSFEEGKSGLYNLVRRIESMEGKSMIHSEPGRGVEIKITFKAG